MATYQTSDFIGVGLAFPLKLDANGTAQLITGWELIKSSLSILLAYQVGTRFMLGEYGSCLDNLLEEPNNPLLESLAKAIITQQVEQWEKRVKVSEVILIPTLPSGFDLHLKLQIVNTEQEELFIWPHYQTIIY